ncbi:MAG TPA: hypothetical protein ENK68_05035, partial [Epsilonproteobacteria bacterium]|nr:hypothetical protein [Campylobacterota bacterium]
MPKKLKYISLYFGLLFVLGLSYYVFMAYYKIENYKQYAYEKAGHVDYFECIISKKNRAIKMEVYSSELNFSFKPYSFIYERFPISEWCTAAIDYFERYKSFRGIFIDTISVETLELYLDDD